MRKEMAAVLLLGVVSPRLAFAQANANTTVVLHARLADSTATCTSPQTVDGLDCATVHPTVTMPASTAMDVYVFLKNFDAASGLQLKFSWPAGWVFQGWFSGCQPNELRAVVPNGDAERNLGLVFRCTGYGDVLQPIGWLRIVTGASGCLEIETSDYPYGTHLVDCVNVTSAIPGTHWGRVCVGSGGIDRCDPPPPGGWESAIVEYGGGE